MENESRQTEAGRRVSDRRECFKLSYKGWQRRVVPNRRLQIARRSSELFS